MDIENCSLLVSYLQNAYSKTARITIPLLTLCWAGRHSSKLTFVNLSNCNHCETVV